MGWEDLRHLIADHPKVIEKHFPDVAPSHRLMAQRIQDLHAAFDPSRAGSRAQPTELLIHGSGTAIDDAGLTRIALHRLRLQSAGESVARIMSVATPADTVILSLQIGRHAQPMWGDIMPGTGELITVSAGHRTPTRTLAGGTCGFLAIPTKLLHSHGRAMTGSGTVRAARRMRVDPTDQRGSPPPAALSGGHARRPNADGPAHRSGRRLADRARDPGRAPAMIHPAWASNWAWGLPLIGITLALHSFGVVGIAIGSRHLSALVEARAWPLPQTVLISAAMIGTIGCLLAGLHGVEAAVWALAYLLLGAIGTVSDAMFYSVDSITTRGEAGLVLERSWQMRLRSPGMHRRSQPGPARSGEAQQADQTKADRTQHQQREGHRHGDPAASPGHHPQIRGQAECGHGDHGQQVGDPRRRPERHLGHRADRAQRGKRQEAGDEPRHQPMQR